MKASRRAMEAYKTMINIEKENAAAREEELEKEIDRLREQVRELREEVEKKEKIRAHLKEKTVSRGEWLLCRHLYVLTPVWLHRWRR